MGDLSKTVPELIEEIASLKLKINELEQSGRDLKRVEEELRESEQLFRAIADYTYDWETWVGPDGKLRWVSPSVLDFTGYSVSECFDMSDFPLPLVHEADRERVRQHYVGAVRNTSGKNLEFRVRCKDGSMRWAAVCWQPIYNSAGTSLGHRSSSRDITERRQTEEALIRSQELFRTQFENSPDTIFIMDRSFKFVAINRVPSGPWRPEELIGRDAILPLPLPDQELCRNAAQTCFDTGEIQEIEHETGGGRWARSRIVPIKSDGTINHVMVLDTDITERRRAQEMLRKSEEKYRNMVDNAPIGIYQSSLQGRFLNANEKTAFFLGYESAEELIDSITDIGTQVYVSPDDRAEIQRQLLENGVVQHFRALFRKKDGSIIWGLLNARTVRDEKGDVLYLEGTSQDITEIKEAQEERDRILDMSSDLICVAGMDGYFKYVNPAWEKTLGYPREHFLSRPFLDFIHPEDHRKCGGETEKLASGQTMVDFEIRNIHKDGSVRTFLWTATPLAGSRLVYCIGRDITERKRVEEELENHRKHLEETVKERTAELKAKSRTLEEINVALKVLLKRGEEDRKELEEQFVSNIKGMILPYIVKLQKGKLDVNQKAYLDIVAANLNEILSPFLDTIRRLDFTPKEIEVASFIKEGRTTKDIAELMGVAPSAIDAHRNNIRIKLGLNNKKVNLRSYLLSLK
jgi:PAS domain S-box-containing protein